MGTYGNKQVFNAGAHWAIAMRMMRWTHLHTQWVQQISCAYLLVLPWSRLLFWRRWWDAGPPTWHAFPAHFPRSFRISGRSGFWMMPLSWNCGKSSILACLECRFQASGRWYRCRGRVSWEHYQLLIWGFTTNQLEVSWRWGYLQIISGMPYGTPQLTILNTPVVSWAWGLGCGRNSNGVLVSPKNEPQHMLISFAA